MAQDKRAGKPQKRERNHAKNPQSLDALFDVFYHAKVSEGMADRTLASYRENYGYLAEYMDAQGLARDVRHVTVELIRNYIAWMLREKELFEGHRYKPKSIERKGLSPVTVNGRLKTLRTMFRFLAAEDKIDHDPFPAVKRVKEDADDVVILTAQELNALFAAPNQRRYAGFRDHVLMNVLFDSFGRINETLELRGQDVHFESGGILLRKEVTKGRRDRFIRLEARTLRLISELIRENEDFDTEYIFLANYGERLTAGQFRHRLKEYARKVGITKRVHPHLFRHTAATMFLENGGDSRYLQEILGHKDARMIQRYTHLAESVTVQEQHEKYSPMKRILKAGENKRRIVRKR